MTVLTKYDQFEPIYLPQSIVTYNAVTTAAKPCNSKVFLKETDRKRYSGF
jgi:hypothetical protein